MTSVDNLYYGALIVAAQDPVQFVPLSSDLYPIMPMAVCLLHPDLVCQGVSYTGDQLISVFDGVMRVVKGEQEIPGKCALLMMQRASVIGMGKAAALTKSACQKAQAIQNRVLGGFKALIWCENSNSTGVDCSQVAAEKEATQVQGAQDMAKLLKKEKSLHPYIASRVVKATQHVLRMFGCRMGLCTSALTDQPTSIKLGDKIVCLDETGKETTTDEDVEMLRDSVESQKDALRPIFENEVSASFFFRG